MFASVQSVVTTNQYMSVTRLIGRLRGRSIDDRLPSDESLHGEDADRRRDELVSIEHRRTVAGGLRHLVELVEHPCGRRAVPLRKQAVTDSRGQLLALAGGLQELEEVRPRGVILASRLVDNASSPAFAVSREREDLGHAVRYARAALRDR